jgi:hypothetical protein
MLLTPAKQFEEPDAIIVACVHDEIVVGTNEDIAEKMSKKLEHIMENAAREFRTDLAWLGWHIVLWASSVFFNLIKYVRWTYDEL